MNIEFKSRIFAVTMALLMMLPVILLAFVLDLPYKFLQWEIITAFVCFLAIVCLVVDWALSRRRFENKEQ
ncbi:hypothetical protein C9I99_21310 [Photobacterium lutimaris]|uniref:Uncharacterized protein n=1 Tax=Photobacterium lutimaris TaxID=388278 RepID=A0A2T3ITN9_9GAMM|nr:hypothetical protein C9I99_21310 [Photobacterium lutimaris]TDR72633.1 hypothetical protein DFP78_113109 [Photobacterium lutimaris]